MRRVAVPVLALALALLPVRGVAEEACADADPRDCPHSEYALVPVFGFNTDTGLSLGAFVQFARFEPGARPYAARVQVQGSVSVLDGADGLELPYHNHFLLLDLPAVPGPAYRLFFTLGYARLTEDGYYGIGNRSAAVASLRPPDAEPYTGYLREHIEVRALLQRRLAPSGLRLHFGVAVTRPTLTAYASSRLAEDIEAGVAPPVGQFWQTAGILGLLLDRRDHEVFPTEGFFGDLVFRAVPGLLNAHDFVGATATGRLYLPLFSRRVVLASRILGDVLVGEAPLNELSRYGGVLGNAGLGGSTAVRGVPLGRFVGKTKVIGNLELRSLFFPFRALRQRMVLGAAMFVDAGRVWTGTFARDARRDGTGLGLHAGFGGGPRLRWGDAFLLRTDVAAAPGADPGGRGTALGLYLTGDAAF